MSSEGKGENVGGATGATGSSNDENKEKKPSLLEQTTSNQSTSEWFNSFFTSLKLDDQPKIPSLLEEVSFEGIAKYIKSGKCKKIVTMAGAGISTSAGIPDFRTPGTGLYDNLEKYKLPNPMSVFEIDYFQENPEPFFCLCKELFPQMSFKPTPCHYFIKLLEDKNILLRHFTQNIDTLERVSGLSEERLVEAHGSFSTGHCVTCKAKYSEQWLRDKIFVEDVIPKCTAEEDCEGGFVKPDIVFFGEQLPSRFVEKVSDMKEADLLIIMGTSLVVHPFASLTGRVKDDVPRLYINLEKSSNGNGSNMMAMFFGGNGFDFDSDGNIRDVFWQGTCDDGCYALAKLLGWEADLRKLVKEGHAKIDKAKATGAEKRPVTKSKA